MSSAPTPESLLRFRGPNLVDGFTDTFSSRYVDVREVCMHAVIGREGSPLLLVHGWSQTWYAWRVLIPAPARGLRVHRRRPAPDRAVRQATRRVRRGHPHRRPGRTDGRAHHTRFALFGTVTGVPIADKFRRLTMSVLAIGGAESTGEGVPGTMKCAPTDVHRVVLADCGHWVAEQGPEELMEAPTGFLASYRDGGVGKGAEDPSAASTTVIEDTSFRPEGDPNV